MDKLQEVINQINKNRVKAVESSYKCDLCKDIGYTFKYDEKNNRYAIPCKCKEVEKRKERMLESGIDEADLQKGFKDFQTFDETELVQARRKGVEYFNEFVKNNKLSILISGASGRGKTTLGMAILNNIAKSVDISYRYMQYRQEMTFLKQNLINEDVYTSRMNQLKGSRLLFIDDLFKGKVNETDINIMYEIINHRYMNRLPMIISTEMTAQQLIDFDEAIGGRIVEMCKPYLVQFSDNVPNYRLRS